MSMPASPGPAAQGSQQLRPAAAVTAAEAVTLDFTDAGVPELARIAAEVNRAVENIDARRPYTVMQRLFDEPAFTVPDRRA